MISRYGLGFKHLDFLKRDFWVRISISALYMFLFFAQIGFIVYGSAKHSLTFLQIGLSVLFMATMILFAAVSLFYAFKRHRNIASVKSRGQTMTEVFILKNTTKRSLLNLYSAVCNILSLIITLALVSVITYGILNYVKNSSFSFYTPILFALCIAAFNTSYHLRSEIYIINEGVKINNPI